MNKAVLTPKIWLIAIHSQNSDLIHLLEASKVEPPSNNYLNCFNESIKCHHNNFASYFEKKKTTMLTRKRMRKMLQLFSNITIMFIFRLQLKSMMSFSIFAAIKIIHLKM